MTGPISFEATASVPGSRRARLALAIVSTLVLLGAIGAVEVAVLAIVTIVSSGTNRR
jgi:hypothetical protein